MIKLMDDTLGEINKQHKDTLDEIKKQNNEVGATLKTQGTVLEELLLETKEQGATIREALESQANLRICPLE